MAGGTVAAFWAVSFLLVITPGADWAYAIAAGLRHSTVLPAVGGLLTGHLAATAAVAAGVAAVLARSPLAMATLTAAGAGYLVWLGVSTLAHPSVPQAGAEPADESWVRQAAKGAGISGLNPKVFLLFLALLPQFTDPAADWPLAAQVVSLGLVHELSAQPGRDLTARRTMEDEMRHEAALEVQARITSSFERQGLMRHLGARLGLIAPGRVHIVLPSRPEITQQHGFSMPEPPVLSPTARADTPPSQCSPRRPRCSPSSTRSTSWRRPQVSTLRPSERS
jgi:threonine/homoserine/homoserine lactone efflux protein